MKLVLISDLHGQSTTLYFLKTIIKKEKPDAIIISGDITTAGATDFFDELEKIISRSRVPALIVWGNSDLPDAIDRIKNSKFCIHLQKVRLGSFEFFGIGETDDALNVSNKIKNTILITHRPPDLGFLKEQFKNAPDVHISGHLHRKKTAAPYPSTFHISVPTLQGGEYAVFYPKTKKVEFLRAR